MPRFSKGLLSLMFRNQNVVDTFPLPSPHVRQPCGSPIWFLLILSPEYLVRNKDHKISHKAIFPNPLSARPPKPKQHPQQHPILKHPHPTFSLSIRDQVSLLFTKQHDSILLYKFQ
jgi:hypothetical protein